VRPRVPRRRTENDSPPWKQRLTAAMVYLFSFLMDITITLVVLGLNFRAVDMGATPTELGVLGSSLALPYSIVCFTLARRLSSIDVRLSSALSSAFLMVLCVASGMVASLGLFILLGVLVGAASALFWPPLEHHLGQGKPPEQLYGALSRFNLWWCSGYALATGICGLLYKWSFRLPFMTAAACLLPIIAGSPFLTRRNSFAAPVSSFAKAHEEKAGLEKKRFFLTTARIFIFLTYASAGCIIALFPKLGDSLRLSKPVISVTIFFFYLGQLLSFSILAKTRKWQESVACLLGGQVFMAAAFLAVFVCNHTAVFGGAFAVVGLASGLSYFSSLYYTLHEPVFKSSLAGVHEALLASGRLFGPVFFGAIAGLSNLKFPYLVLALIFAFFALHTLLRRPRLV